MARDRIIDPADYPLDRIEADEAAIHDLIPHRRLMLLVTRVLHYDSRQGLVVGHYEVPEEPFWADGHFPGQPIMPGVLVTEANAQLCCYYFQRHLREDGNHKPQLLLLNRLDQLVFRGTVKPGDDLILVVKNTSLRTRKAEFESQAFVGDRLIFTGHITGMPVATP